MNPARIRAQWLFLPFLFLCLCVTSCAVNPFRTAQSVEQKGDVLYGEYVIVKEQGAVLLADVSIPDSAKRPLAEAMVASRSAANSLQDALIEYSQIKAQLAAGTSSQEKLSIAEQNIAAWIATAQPLIATLITTTKGLVK